MSHHHRHHSSRRRHRSHRHRSGDHSPDSPHRKTSRKHGHHGEQRRRMPSEEKPSPGKRLKAFFGALLGKKAEKSPHKNNGTRTNRSHAEKHPPESDRHRTHTRSARRRRRSRSKTTPPGNLTPIVETTDAPDLKDNEQVSPRYQRPSTSTERTGGDKSVETAATESSEPTEPPPPAQHKQDRGRYRRRRRKPAKETPYSRTPKPNVETPPEFLLKPKTPSRRHRRSSGTTRHRHSGSSQRRRRRNR